MKPQVVIVGAGLAGLCCALKLQQAGTPTLLLEASDGVGGRVRTDELDGFLLDRGFQVLLTAYPEAKRVLDYNALQLKSFYPGAMVYFGGDFKIVADPFRKPLDAAFSAFNPIGTLGDKLKVAKVRSAVRAGTVADTLQRPEKTTEQALRDYGFSDTMIDRFFRPFFGGVMLDRGLNASSRMFDFVFRMFSEGDTALPARGMGEIPKQLAARLPEGSVRLGARVTRIEASEVTLDNGETIPCEAVVLATDHPEAARLSPELKPAGRRSVTCLYYRTDHDPLRQPILALDGEGQGPVNNLCVPSAISPHYAPEGQSLVSASVVEGADRPDDELDAAARKQLAGWFGKPVEEWELLRTYRISYALPEQAPPALSPPERPAKLGERLYVCGDHRDNASIQGAMVSGRRAAEALLQDLGP